MPEVDDAPVIVSSVPGSFARSVLAERHPALIQQVRDAFPWPPERHRALDALLASCTEGVIEPLGPDAHDRDQWDAWGGEYVGRSWFDVPFLWSESYFYRRLLGATGYFAPGPWQGIDPFAPFKEAELRGSLVDDELAALDALARRPVGERAAACLRGSLWGNRADLGFAVGSPDGVRTAARPGTSDADAGDEAVRGSSGASAVEDPPPLVADDSDALWALLPAGRSPGAVRTVHVIADNAGRELIPDLVLIDHLLTTEHADGVVLHVKPYPYYVSDATTADVVDCVRRLAQASGSAGGAGERLWAAMGDGRLAVRAHAFYCAPFTYGEMPADLRGEFAGAALTIVKGDLNYRRLVGDRLWAPTTPFAERTAYFPGPVAALRTLKSDVIVGLDPRTVARLEDADASGGARDGANQAWRTSGTHALIQVRP
ncbi:damage-control phosphatase ARMT1 family protein [Streptomyces sp. NBC_01725]|uniref:damage-control phosphatase ARMT1 family protein n=1 Tax=Streptomyces sp. NBC_01725 TaxID=2975923 RepID=UPI002E281DF4|nr:damage-control phosphatase ARMT1 family protein [Streptomyces sp. NBC_01725]